MSWFETAPALATVLAGVAGIGRVHVGERHLRDETRMRELLHAPQDGEPDRMAGAFLGRVSIEEDWWSSQRTDAREVYRLRMFRAIDSAQHSDRDFQGVVAAVSTALRGRTSIGSAYLLDAADVAGISAGPVAQVNCHVAEVLIPVRERYTVGSVTQPASVASTASGRTVYESTAEELAWYVASATGCGRVHADRRFGIDEKEAQALLEMQAEDTPDRSEIRAWVVFRASDREERGIGNRIDAAPGWRLAHYRGWHDATDSYDDCQRHLDAVREVFRGVGVLGNTTNPTMAVSSPLQVDEIGEGLAFGRLVHLVSARVRVQEVVHA